MKFSQKDEEKYILEHFKGKTDGRFLDIGAYTGVEFSNTRALALLGWSGVLVEPSPKCFPILFKNYEGNKKVTFINLAIGSHCGETEFYDSGGAVATTIKESYERWKGIQLDFEKITVPMIDVARLLQLVGSSFEFISIDTEGMDLEILNQLAEFKFCDASMLCVEYGNNAERMFELLIPRGYKPIYSNDENIIFIKK